MMYFVVTGQEMD